MKRRHPNTESLVEELESEGYQAMSGGESYVEVLAKDGHSYAVHFTVSETDIFVESMMRSDFDADDF
jgi:hypothetical protein